MYIIKICLIYINDIATLNLNFNYNFSKFIFTILL